MKPLLTLIFILTIFLAPDFVFAQAAPSVGFIPCEGASCSACDAVTLINNIIKWLIGILFLFFAVLAVIAGFKLVTSGGNSGAKEAAKSSFTNAFIGLFIVLGAWLLVDTLLKGVLDGGTGEIKGYGPWAQVQCVKQNATGIGELIIEEGEFVPNIIRTTASGDNAIELSSPQLDQRLAAINATGDVTLMANSALDALGITDPQQRKHFRGLISQESSNCRNKTGPDTGKGRGRAYGCIQTLVGTAREIDAKFQKRFVGKTNSEVSQMLLADNAYNILLGASYYKDGLRRYGTIESALARYNGGDGALRPSRSCPGLKVYECTLNGGYAQTRHYVKNIKAIAGRL